MTSPMEQDFGGLRKLAEAATPGPWEVIESTRGDWPSLYIRPPNDGIIAQIMAGIIEGRYRHNAAFIAAANPAAILSLLDALEAAEQTIASLRGALEPFARLADDYEEHGMDHDESVMAGRIPRASEATAVVTFADFRRARRALTPESP